MYCQFSFVSLAFGKQQRFHKSVINEAELKLNVKQEKSVPVHEVSTSAKTDFKARIIETRWEKKTIILTFTTCTSSVILERTSEKYS